MVNLTKANRELYRRNPDECFESLESLRTHCHDSKEQSSEHWFKPQSITPIAKETGLSIAYENGQESQLNDWSFSQLCRLCGVSSDTINRLSPQTAQKAIAETLPSSTRPIQFFNGKDEIRSIHGVTYTRLWNSEVLDVVAEFGSEFQPPNKGTDW